MKSTANAKQNTKAPFNIRCLTVLATALCLFWLTHLGDHNFAHASEKASLAQTQVSFPGLVELNQASSLMQLSVEDKRAVIEQIEMQFDSLFLANEGFVSDAALLLLKFALLNNETAALRFIERFESLPLPISVKKATPSSIANRLAIREMSKKTTDASRSFETRLHLHKLWWHPADCMVAVNGVRLSKESAPVVAYAQDEFFVQKICDSKSASQTARGVVPSQKSDLHISSINSYQNLAKLKKNTSLYDKKNLRLAKENPWGIYFGHSYGVVGKSKTELSQATLLQPKVGVSYQFNSVFGAEFLGSFHSEFSLFPNATAIMFQSQFTLTANQHWSDCSLGLKGGAGFMNLAHSKHLLNKPVYLAPVFSVSTPFSVNFDWGALSASPRLWGAAPLNAGWGLDFLIGIHF